jgi:hypothetical protein
MGLVFCFRKSAYAMQYFGFWMGCMEFLSAPDFSASQITGLFA